MNVHERREHVPRSADLPTVAPAAKEAPMTQSVPTYESGAHTAMSREEALAILDRLAQHLREGTTDVADDQLRIPISYYRDPDQWEREIRDVFLKIPLPVCTSAELASVGDYKALRVVGREVLLVRGRDGLLRAMLNVCRHRAMKLVPGGCGNSRRGFVCSYHAWSYDHDGRRSAPSTGTTTGWCAWRARSAPGSCSSG
jgi:nitrite reductase/ring-hydroxylating ferredoxin subunit